MALDAIRILVMDEEEYIKAQKELQEAVDDLRKLRNQRSRSKGITPEAPFCSFCGKGHNEVKKLLAGKEAYICNECVELAKEVFDEEPNG